MPDIDIDFSDRNQILNLLPHRTAMRQNRNESIKHNTGVYFHEIPHNPFSNMATIDYQLAEQRGYFKIDLLNVGVYHDVRDEAHLIQLLNTPPNWKLLEHREIVEQLFHINGHFEIVNKLKPMTIEQLAAVLAIIRPAKRHLADSDWNRIEQEVWVKPNNDEYFFKKSHALAYAAAVVIQLNALCEQAEQSDV